MDYSSFDPEEFLKQYFNPQDHGFELYLFTLDRLHDIFSSGKVHGKRLINLGTGPSIHTVISASRYVEEIYLTDYLEQNVSFLKDWWTTSKIRQPEIIDYVLSVEENGESVTKRSGYIKDKIQEITFIDVTKCPVLMSKHVPTSYDVIVSSGCLDAAVTTKEGYIQCVKNVKPLLVHGGYLVLIGDINASFYVVGKENFPCLYISGEEVKEIFTSNGFQIISYDETKCSYPLHICDETVSEMKTTSSANDNIIMPRIITKDDISRADLEILLDYCEDLGINDTEDDDEESLRQKLLKFKLETVESDGMTKDLEEITKRFDHDKCVLNNLYGKVKETIGKPEFDAFLGPEMEKRFNGQLLAKLDQRLTDLQTGYCPIVVTGETSSGKSSFLNWILGADIMPTSVLHCTATICRIKNSEQKGLQITHYADENKKTPKWFPSENAEELNQLIKNYTTTKGKERDEKVEYVDITWPIPILGERITLVDTPGVSDDMELATKLFDYIPEALALIYVLNTPNDGGVQTDRLGKILDEQENRKEKGEKFWFDTSTTLFICNKWDQVGEEEQNIVLDNVLDTLQKNWPGLDRKHVFKLSLTSPIEGNSDEMNRLRSALAKLISGSCDKKILQHTVWLLDFLQDIIRISVDLDRTGCMSIDMRKHFCRKKIDQLEQIEKKARQVKDDRMKDLDKEKNKVAKEIYQHLQSSDAKQRILRSVEIDCRNYQVGDSGKAIKDILANKIKAELIFCCNRPGNNVQPLLSNIEDVIQKTLDEIEEYFSEAHETMNAVIPKSVPSVHATPSALSMLQNTLNFMTTKLLTMVMPMELVWKGMSSIAKLATEKIHSVTYKGSRKEFIIQCTREALHGITEEEISSFLKRKFFKEMLDGFERHFNSLLEKHYVHEKSFLINLIMKTTFDDPKSLLENVLPQCQDLLKQAKEIYFERFTECPRFHDIEDIESLDSDRYKIKAPIEGSIQELEMVAVGEGKSLDNMFSNIRRMRHLKHKNVVQVVGYTIQEDKDSDEEKIFIVTEVCGTPLVEKVDGANACANISSDAETFESRFNPYVTTALQICKGLEYLHGKRWILKKLRLENILVTEADTLKIHLPMLQKEAIIKPGSKSQKKQNIYIAPELFAPTDSGIEITRAVDVYSLAIIFWEMWFGVRAYDTIEIARLDSLDGFISLIRGGYRPQFYKNAIGEIPDGVKSLIERCWMQDASKRPTATEVIKDLEKLV